MPKNSGKMEDFGTRLTVRPSKYERMRMNVTQNKKFKSISRKITVKKETVDDCLASWLTATGSILRNEFVKDIQPDGDLYIVEIYSGKEKEIEEDKEEEKHVEKA